MPKYFPIFNLRVIKYCSSCSSGKFVDYCISVITFTGIVFSNIKLCSSIVISNDEYQLTAGIFNVSQDGCFVKFSIQYSAFDQYNIDRFDKLIDFINETLCSFVQFEIK